MDSSSVFIQSWTFAFSVWIADGLQVSGDIVEKWTVRFDLGISPGRFIPSGADAVVGWDRAVSQEETALPSLSVLAVIMLLSQCKLLAFPSHAG